MPSYQQKPSENVWYKKQPGRVNSARTWILPTHCKWGHLKTGEIPDGQRSRVCVQCRYEKTHNRNGHATSVKSIMKAYYGADWCPPKTPTSP